MLGNPGFITVETVMFFGLGFLLALLLMLAFMPAVHQRAVRLTRRKYDPVPLSVKEMQAEKDRLRADFAMSTRKLEHDIDQMQHKTAAHFTDLARKAETIAQLRETHDARDTLIAQLQSQNTTLTALDRRIHVYDSQQHEIMALTSQSDALRMQLAALARPAQHQPSPGLVPAAEHIENRTVVSNGDGDVIRRALEAIQANGQGHGLGNGHSMPHGWISPPSNGAVPFGH